MTKLMSDWYLKHPHDRNGTRKQPKVLALPQLFLKYSNKMNIINCRKN